MYSILGALWVAAPGMRHAGERVAPGVDISAPTGVVFCAEDGSWPQPSAVTKEFIRMVAEFDLPPIKLHGLRHGAASIEVDSTGGLRAAQLLLGHSSVTTRYVPRASKSARKDAERSAAKLRGKKTRSGRDDDEDRPGALDGPGV